MKVDYSPKAIEARLRMASEMSSLCLSLMKCCQAIDTDSIRQKRPLKRIGKEKVKPITVDFRNSHPKSRSKNHGKSAEIS